MKKILLFLLLISSYCFGQYPYTVNGYPLIYEGEVIVSAVPSAPAPSGLEITYTTGNAPTKTLAEWNSFFKTSTYATTPFTSFTKVGDVVTLYGATNLILWGSAPSNGIFRDNDFIKSIIDYSEEVIELQYNAIALCDNLTEVILDGCITLGKLSLCYNPSLTSISLNSATTFGSASLANNTALTSCSLPSATSIVWENYGSIWNGSSALITINLPVITSVGFAGFASLNNTIENIYLPKATSIGQYGFWTLPSLKYVDLSSCTSLGGSTFGNATGRTMTIKIPHALESHADIVWLKANNTVTVIYSD